MKLHLSNLKKKKEGVLIKVVCGVVDRYQEMGSLHIRWAIPTCTF